MGEAALFGSSQVEARNARPVAYTEATLRARIDPSGLATTYRFQYGLAEGEYEFVTAPQALSAGAGPTEVQALVGGLAEGTRYHFRVLVESEAGKVEGPEREFTTLAQREAESCPNAEYRTGFSASLPDCRAYELVTPGQTNGLRLLANTGSSPTAFDNWLTPQRGAGAGQSLAYYVNGALPGFDGNGFLDGYRAARVPGEHPAAGWQSSLFSPNYPQAVPGSFATPSVEGVSPDQLYSAWVVNAEKGQVAELADGAYLRTPSGFEALGRGELGEDPQALGLGLGAGGAHVLFSSTAHLEEAAAPAGTTAIYDRAAGSATSEVVSVKPGGGAFGAGEGATLLGTSEAADAVAFSAVGKLYVHREGATVEVAEAPFAFAGLSEDGSRVFYAAGASGAAQAPLLACDVEAGPCAGPSAQAPIGIGPAGSEGTLRQRRRRRLARLLLFHRSAHRGRRKRQR